MTAAAALLFAFGASYSAFADDGLTAGTEATVETPLAETTTETVGETTTMADPAPEPAPEPAPDPTVTVVDPAPSEPDIGGTTGGALPGDGSDLVDSGAETQPPVSDGSGGDESADGGPSSSPSASVADAEPVLRNHHRKARPAETDAGAAATIWLLRTLPDPTPPARRLAPAFARELRAAARGAGVRWSLVLAVLRARGADGPYPAHAAALERLSSRLARLGGARHERRAVHRLAGGSDAAKQIFALSRYNRAVGLGALVHGLEAAKPRLSRCILRDERIDLYAGGRADIAAGRINVRVIVLIRYLAVSFHQVTISSLETGHRLFARPGVISAHAYGLAVDISSIAGRPIYLNQQPGAITERAIEAIMRLPAELQPQQIISLLGLGGPSFPLPDHYDHIHVGY